MKKVYVAGSYSADNVLDVLKNIGRGRQACAKLFSMGFAPYCPWHDASFITDRPGDDFDVKQFQKASIEWLKVSDLLVYLSGSENSGGTQREIQLAKELNIPVINYEAFINGLSIVFKQ